MQPVRHFEVCLFNRLKSGDLCVPGHDEYGNYRDQLITWEECQRDIEGYAERAGVPADAEHWLGWTRHFGPVSDLKTKFHRPRERTLATTFCYGGRLGPSQAARFLKGLDRRVAFVNQRHVTEGILDDAISGVIEQLS